MDKNIVMLEGTIGEDFKYAKTRDKRDFATFTVGMNTGNYEERDDTEKRIPIFIRVMVFDEKCIQYLKKIGARSGSRCSIFGRLNSHRMMNNKGFSIVVNDVVVRDIHIVKTKSDEDVSVNEAVMQTDIKDIEELYGI